MKLRIKFREKEKKEDGEVNYYPAGNGFSPWQFGRNLRQLIEEAKRCEKKTEILFLCIGSDRITGDCLGPYIGHLLHPHESARIFVYGTLSDPVHALNLEKFSELIGQLHPHALVIAIDASLGQKKHLGYVTIGNGALYPSAGVQKNLPPVGDIHITGIVNIAGMLEQLTLQTTRLSTVISLADAIADGILRILPSEAERISC